MRFASDRPSRPPARSPHALTAAVAPLGRSHGSGPRSLLVYPAPRPPRPRAARPPRGPGTRPSTSPGGRAALTSQSEPAELLRSAALPNQRLRGSLAPPTPRPGLAPPCRSSSKKPSCPSELRVSPLAPRYLERKGPHLHAGPSSARLLLDHAVPHLHTQMAEDLVARIPFPWGDSLGCSSGVQHRALTLSLGPHGNPLRWANGE